MHRTLLLLVALLASAAGATQPIALGPGPVSGGSTSGSAGGDLSGTYPNPTVAKLKSIPLGIPSSAAGTYLGGDGLGNIQALTFSGDLTADGTGVVTLTNGATTRSHLGLGTGDSPTFSGVTDSGLTSTRLLFAGTGGLLSGVSTLALDSASSPTKLTVGFGTASSSTTTGSLVVTGGIGSSGQITGVTISATSNVLANGLYGKVQTLTSGTTAGISNDCTLILDGTSSTVTFTLPAANAGGVNRCQVIFIHCLNATNTVTVQRAGSDTITGPAGVGVTSFTMSTNTGFDLRSDGVSKWFYH